MEKYPILIFGVILANLENQLQCTAEFVPKALKQLFLTSAQRSAEVRALKRALCFYISGYVFLQFVVNASLILDTLPFHASKDFNSINSAGQSH